MLRYIRDKRLGHNMKMIVCRVCGVEFVAPRRDSVTCSATCRQRLHRGGAFAYFEDLSPKQRRAERKRHDAHDKHLTACKVAVAATRAMRELKRAQRLKRVEQKRERVVAEVTGRAYLAVQKQKREQGTLATVAGVLKLFAQQHRNDMSAEAIADLTDYPVKDIAHALDQLRASGDAERIVEEATKGPEVDAEIAF